MTDIITNDFNKKYKYFIFRTGYTFRIKQMFKNAYQINKYFNEYSCKEFKFLYIYDSNWCDNIINKFYVDKKMQKHINYLKKHIDFDGSIGFYIEDGDFYDALRIQTFLEDLNYCCFCGPDNLTNIFVYNKDILYLCVDSESG